MQNCSYIAHEYHDSRYFETVPSEDLSFRQIDAMKYHCCNEQFETIFDISWDKLVAYTDTPKATDLTASEIDEGARLLTERRRPRENSPPAGATSFFD
jgi:hypothetical protein